MQEKINVRNRGLDFLKFVATIFITNSHFVPLYPEKLKFLATFGVHGDALFYFTSGYLLMMGLCKQNECFSFWMKKRIRRLWPASIIWVIVTAIIWNIPIDWKALVFASRYWFVWCITIYYVLLYMIVFYLKKTKQEMMQIKYIYIATIILALCVVPFIPWYIGSIYHSDFNSFYHFSIFLLGGILYLKKDHIIQRPITFDLAMLLIMYFIYTISVSYGKGHEGTRYYVQLLGYLPLHAFCYHAYQISCRPWTNLLFNIKGAKWIFIILSSLTLEIYIVQWQLITPFFNNLFPLNLIIVFTIIVGSAYLLKIAVNIFLQLWTTEPFCLRDCYRLN